MNEELRINSEESDAIDSYHKFSERGDEYFYKEEYDSAIKNMERALDALERYIPANIKIVLVNLSHRLLFLGLRNEILLQLGISYRKSGYHYKAKQIFEDLIYFTKEFSVDNILGFKEMILGYYPIPRDELLRRVWSEIALIYKDLKLYNKALESFYKSSYKPLINASFSYLNPWLEIAYLHKQLQFFVQIENIEVSEQTSTAELCKSAYELYSTIFDGFRQYMGGNAK